MSKDQLDQGKIEPLVTALRAVASSDPDLAEDIFTEANYFESNQERMRYSKLSFGSKDYSWPPV